MENKRLMMMRDEVQLFFLDKLDVLSDAMVIDKIYEK